jgi:adenylate cyclase
MHRATSRRVRRFLWFLVVGVLTGVAYGGLLGAMFRGTSLIGSMVGAIDGAAIAAPIAGAEIFLSRTRWGRAIQRAPFLVTFGVKWLVYGGLITLVNLESPGVRTLHVLGLAAPLPRSLALLSLAFSFAVTFAVLFIFQVSHMVGPRNLAHIVLGRYYRPHLEERFFLFVDIAGSTALAERLGPVAVHRFLANVFRLASDPIADYGGEIYQYVGDEVVVTWPVAAGRAGARPIACFFAFCAVLDDAAPRFEEEFGAVPTVRAALHAGSVIAGEIGDSKRDIVFHGDVMNTAARLEQATRDLHRPFLASADAVIRLDGVDVYALEPLGPRALRGRAGLVEVYSVGLRRPSTTAEERRNEGREANASTTRVGAPLGAGELARALADTEREGAS